MEETTRTEYHDTTKSYEGIYYKTGVVYDKDHNAFPIPQELFEKVKGLPNRQPIKFWLSFSEDRGYYIIEVIPFGRKFRRRRATVHSC